MKDDWTALYLPSTTGLNPTRSGFDSEEKAWKYTEQHFCQDCRNLIAKAEKTERTGYRPNIDEFVKEKLILIEDYENKNELEQDGICVNLYEEYVNKYGNFNPGCDAEWSVCKTLELYEGDVNMLKDSLRNNIMKAVKAKDIERRDLLKVALGEIQTFESRKGSITEEEAQKALRKMVTSNNETINILDDEIKIGALKKEIEILEEFLPQLMCENEIAIYIAVAPELQNNIKNSNNDGQAIGTTIKMLKSDNKIFDGGVVAKVVKEIRNG